MYFIGYLIYAVIIAAIFYVPAAHDLVFTAYELAREITVGCLAVASFPLLQFLYYNIRGFRGQFYYERLVSVSNTCGNTVVSLGLIGTFVGLTNMIAKIASAIGGEGGSIDEQIALIMSAIGESLDAMSFAFLTSVMGVAASVTIFCATVYFKMFFDKNDDLDSSDVSDEALSIRIEALEEETVKLRHFISKLTSVSVDRQEVSSIIVSNTLQIKALSKLLGDLKGSVEGQVSSNESFEKGLSELTSALTKVENNQFQLLKFASASYESLEGIKDTSQTAVNIYAEKAESTDKIVSALKQALKDT